MTLAELIKAYALVSGMHTAGHFDEASRQGVPISLDTKTFTEVWGTPSSDRDSARINGAGFENQDNLVSRTDDRAMDMANALYKALYASGLTLGGGNFSEGGDINATAKYSGNKRTKELLLASALFDLVRSQQDNPNWKLNFHVTDGAPGLMLNYRW